MNDKESQTDEELIYNYAWSKYYQHFINYYLSSQNLNKPEIESNNDKLDFESIKKLSETAMESKGFVYDQRTGLYFDSQNALYYNQDIKLYIDIENGIYYNYILNHQTNTYQLRFHSKMKKKDWKNLCKIYHLQDVVDIDKKEVEISEESEIDDEIENISYLNSKYPPCIRAILVEADESSSFELGSLFIIPYTGGIIGNSKNDTPNYLINFQNNHYIDEIHVTIKYNQDKNLYFVKDENSKNGTLLNNSKLEPRIETEIKHGDKLILGKNISLLLHIHEGTNTCINCEPGEVIHKLKLEKEKSNQSFINLKSKEELRRENNKLIKQKYGIKGEETFKISSDKYTDRATQRRKEVGIDTSHIVKPNQSQVDVKIDESNIGMKLLSKMGWKEGKGLGKSESGITEPISTKIKLDKAGIGSADIQCNMEVDEKQKRKIINWNKTKERFQSIQDNSKLSSVFNIEDDE